MTKYNAYGINVTQEIVQNDITVANICYNLMFKWINGIQAKGKHYRRFEAMFHYIERSVSNEYVLSLAKIYAKSREASLERLVIQAHAVTDEIFEMRLERYPGSPQELARKRRKDFFRNYVKYIARIQKIREMLEPLRNVSRAHNHPTRSVGTGNKWYQSKRWLNYAESVYISAMDASGLSTPRQGKFVPREIDYQIEDYIKNIKAKN